MLTATLAALSTSVASGQEVGTLRIKVTLANDAEAAVPVSRHALLISDNPATSAPRRVLTTRDGTAEVRLRPGNYTVESDAPVTFAGKGYQWMQTLDIVAGREYVLELTAGNAEIGAPGPSSASSTTELGSTPENDPYFLLSEWQNSIVAIWTPASRASGFLVGSTGLIVTNQRVIGNATAVEVQVSPSTKVAARVLASDAARDTAVVWIDPAIVAAIRPIPFDCAGEPAARPTEGQRVLTIGAPLHGEKDLSFADVRIGSRGSIATFRLTTGGLGGPVFNTGGSVVGLSSVAGDEDQQSRGDARIVPAADACAVLNTAEKAMQTASRPAATTTPVEPQKQFPTDALEAMVKRRVGSLNPYAVESSEFDVAFLTPVHVFAAAQAQGRGAPAGQRISSTDLGRWSDYFQDAPPVLAIRVTPRMAESFWATVARGAAMTQGMAIPAIKHFKAGFSRMQAFCGDVEVAPIHPFMLETAISETDAVREGLYVFDPQALGPHCKSVKLVMYSEKEPGKADAKVIEPALVDRIWEDFAPHRL